MLTFLWAAFSFRLFWLHGKEAFSEVVSRCILLVFLEVKSPQAHLFPSDSHFHVFFSFNSTFRFAILSCFNPAETFHLGFRHVCLHSLPPSPPNNPINARAVWVPGYDFFEVSYFTLVVKGLKCSHRKMSANISPSKRLTAYSNHHLLNTWVDSENQEKRSYRALHTCAVI